MSGFPIKLTATGPIGLGAIMTEMKLMRSEMGILMSELRELRSENNLLTREVMSLRKNQESNNNGVRQELSVLRAALTIESTSTEDYYAQSMMSRSSEAFQLPETEELPQEPSSSDMRDVSELLKKPEEYLDDSTAGIMSLLKQVKNEEADESLMDPLHLLPCTSATGSSTTVSPVRKRADYSKLVADKVAVESMEKLERQRWMAAQRQRKKRQRETEEQRVIRRERERLRREIKKQERRSRTIPSSSVNSLADLFSATGIPLDKPPV